MSVAAVFGRNLIRERKRAQLSQEALGARASLHPTAIGQLERGERTARIDTLVKLAGALDIPPGDLLVGLKWNPGSSTAGEFVHPSAN